MLPWIIAAESAVICCVTLALLIPVLVKRGIVDRPNHRSSHITVTPRAGGIGLVLAAVVAWLTHLVIAPAHVGSDALALYLGCVLIAVVGFVDDVRSLSASVRLIATVGVAVAIGVGIGASPWILLVFVFWFTGLVNSVNFMDGINGISGVFAMTCGVWFALVGGERGEQALLVNALVLSASAMAFLPFNVPRARVFLGDVGSYFIGGVVATLAAQAYLGGAGVVVAIAPATIYVVDTTYALVVKKRENLGFGEAHRFHTYQVLVDRGLSHATVAMIVGAFVCATCVAAWFVGSWQIAALVMLVISLVYLALPSILSKLKTT